MRKLSRSWCTWVIAAAATTATGCIDAVSQGFADGVNEGLSTVTSTLIESIFSGITGGAE